LKLFQPFSKLKANQELNPNGTGLGLFNCKKVLDRLGSKIWIEPSRTRKAMFEEDVGTVVSFTIKLYPRIH
jgi:signal transduction histidine kinase